MAEILINTPDDMQWLRDVYLPDLDTKFKAAVLDDETVTESITVYEAVDPLITDIGVTYKADSNDVFVRSES